MSKRSFSPATLANIPNVQISGLSDGHAIVYRNGVWVNETASFSPGLAWKAPTDLSGIGSEKQDVKVILSTSDPFTLPTLADGSSVTVLKTTSSSVQINASTGTTIAFSAVDGKIENLTTEIFATLTLRYYKSKWYIVGADGTWTVT